MCVTLFSDEKITKIPLAPMGVLFSGSAHARPSALPPIDVAEISRRTCLQIHLQTSPPTPQKSYPKFRNPRTTFGNTPLCPSKYSIVRGVGVPNFLGGWNPNIFVT